METREKIPVYINIRNGKTVCLCHVDHKRCNKNCPTDYVERDKFDGWKDIMHQDRYGKRL